MSRVILRRVGLVLVVAVLMVLALQGRSAAQSTINLQADIFQLRQQVNQLQAQVSQLSRPNYSAPRGGTAPRGSAPTSRPRSPELSDADIVDRLAILAIEAKDRLNALEQRVTKLERSKPQAR
ncbi:hypothetical protein H6F43_17325 [Leptolyngbya sp. FACHB-36]|uniref:hypothetical protein n=1 Tax=Leptolyngbya sp. FACHB-36 TaxID=2692808 RepID=UPI0016802B2A|nr:hypothetical protein [Leptolyngbya sp. FACHB-36]MBD2021944.1 hypothetical protein [Leptolyngbya sp. FACHB-36]